MDELSVAAVPDGGHQSRDGRPHFRLYWVVNGVNLLTRIDVIEGRTDVEQPPYIGVPAEHTAGPEHLGLVRAAREPNPVALIAECSCTSWGCAAVICDVDRTDGVVTWQNIRRGNAARSVAIPFGPPGIADLRFDADQYDLAMDDPVVVSAPPA